jgi:hypothetical protein
LRPKDVSRAVLAGFVHHQRGIPSRRLAEDIGMPQQQAPRSPPRLAESEEQPVVGVGLCRIGFFDEGNDHFQQVRLLPNSRLVGMIGIPREMGKSGCDKDDAMFVG